MFVGYDDRSKGYCYFNPLTKRVIVSKDVVFDEHSIGLSLVLWQQQSKNCQLVQPYRQDCFMMMRLLDHNDWNLSSQECMHHLKYKLIYQAMNEWNPFWMSKECQRTNHASTTTSSKDSYSNPCPNTCFQKALKCTHAFQGLCEPHKKKFSKTSRIL